MPPLALASSFQISRPSRNILPAPAFGPVSDMPKPILIGSAANAGESTVVNPRILAPLSSCRRLTKRELAGMGLSLVGEDAHARVEVMRIIPGSGRAAFLW